MKLLYKVFFILLISLHVVYSGMVRDITSVATLKVILKAAVSSGQYFLSICKQGHLLL